MGTLTDRLIANAQSNMYPFHMPGHKRVESDSPIPYGIDITEVENFDDLHHPEGIIFELIERWKQIYGADEVFLLVNGSTAGILTAISATVPEKEEIIVARNSHKSVYNAIYLRKSNAHYIYPKYDAGTGIPLAVSAEQVEAMVLDKPNCKTVLITSPTYEGVISDVKAISEVCHRNGAILIVDAAHGAHLGISETFPANPLKEGADIVIMSLHKTLPTLTQSAILCTKGDRVDVERVRRFFDIYVTSSPSYLMLASMDECADRILAGGERLFSEYAKRLSSFRERCKYFDKLYLFESENYDCGKLVICTDRTDMSGSELAGILRTRYEIETEMSSMKYVIAMTSFEDSEAAYERLFDALKEIDGEVTEACERLLVENFCTPKKVMQISEAYDAECERVRLSQAVGRIAADYIYIYPPGIPWVAPGERISEEIRDKAKYYSEHGFDVRGIDNGEIKVVK